MYFYDTEAGITNITDVHVASRANPYILEVRSGQPRAVWAALQAMADAPTARQSSGVAYDVMDAPLQWGAWLPFSTAVCKLGTSQCMLARTCQQVLYWRSDMSLHLLQIVVDASNVPSKYVFTILSECVGKSLPLGGSKRWKLRAELCSSPFSFS